MGEDTVAVPEYYKVFAAELKGLVAMIDEAFINRPVPRGKPWQDLRSALLPVMGSTGDSIKTLTKSINALSGHLASKAAGSVGAKNNDDVVAELNAELSNMIGCFHMIWQSPFPREFADGQPLLSAVVEDVLRECRTFFLKFIDITEMPLEKIAEKYGSNKINLLVTFGDQSALRFMRWFNARDARPRPCSSSAQRGLSSPRGGARNVSLNLLKIFIWGILISLFGAVGGLAPIVSLGAIIVVVLPLVWFFRCTGNFFGWLVRIKSP